MFIIAEVGSNFRDLKDCVESIGKAAAAGADAVKFQRLRCVDLYGFGNDYFSDTPIVQDEWLPKLKEKADACKVEFMCTAFSPEGVDAVNPYVKRHKIASSDLTYGKLLQHVRNTGKPVLLSTGASAAGDIEDALGLLPDVDVTLLYCVSAYPARMCDPAVMQLLRDMYRKPVGFSDHSTEIISLPMQAQFMGATVLEKHFTAFPDLVTPDRPHSLTADEFKWMTDRLKGKRQAIVGPCPEEKDMMLRHNRRMIALKDLVPGEKLVEGVNFGAYRSLEADARGASGLEFFNGEIVKEKVAKGKGISYSDLQTS